MEELVMHYAGQSLRQAHQSRQGGRACHRNPGGGGGGGTSGGDGTGRGDMLEEARFHAMLRWAALMRPDQLLS